MIGPSCSILIIEDEKNILDFMTKALKANNYKVYTATSGQSGLALITSQCPDLVLLDLGLPDIDGNEIISSVRQWTSCPIIVVSARSNERDKVTALDLAQMITLPSLLARRNFWPGSGRLSGTATAWNPVRLCTSIPISAAAFSLILTGALSHWMEKRST